MEVTDRFSVGERCACALSFVILGCGIQVLFTMNSQPNCPTG
jgi:hypothetical protein